MEWYEILGLIWSGLSIPTLIGLVWKIVVDQKQANKKEVKELKSKKRIEEEKAMFAEVLKPLQDQLNNELPVLKQGIQASLRNDLLDAYRACISKGFRSVEDTQNWEKMYEAYHNLGGNSFIDQTKIDFENLDTEEAYRSKYNK